MHRIYFIGLVGGQGGDYWQPSIPFAIVAEAIKEQFGCSAGKDGISLNVVELMSMGVLHLLFSDHCGIYGHISHVLSTNGVLGLAHLNHAKQMRFASFTPDIVDHFLAGELVVHKQVVEAQMLDGGIVEHLLHTEYFVQEVFLPAFFNLGLSIALVAESCVNVPLGNSLWSGMHSSILS